MSAFGGSFMSRTELLRLQRGETASKAVVTDTFGRVVKGAPMGNKNAAGPHNMSGGGDSQEGKVDLNRKDAAGKVIISDSLADKGVSLGETWNSVNRTSDYLSGKVVDLQFSKRVSDRKELPAARNASDEATQKAVAVNAEVKAFEERHGVSVIDAYQAGTGKNWPYYKVAGSHTPMNYVSEKRAELSKQGAMPDMSKKSEVDIVLQSIAELVKKVGNPYHNADGSFGSAGSVDTGGGQSMAKAMPSNEGQNSAVKPSLSDAELDVLEAKANKIGKALLGAKGNGDGARASRDGSVHYEWRQSGGHPNSKLTGIREKAAALGYVKVDTSTSGNADGSVMGGGTVYRHPNGNELEMSSSYGSTQSSNSFVARLRIHPDVIAKKMDDVEEVRKYDPFGSSFESRTSMLRRKGHEADKKAKVTNAMGQEEKEVLPEKKEPMKDEKKPAPEKNVDPKAVEDEEKPDLETPVEVDPEVAKDIPASPDSQVVPAVEPDSTASSKPKEVEEPEKEEPKKEKPDEGVEEEVEEDPKKEAKKKPVIKGAPMGNKNAAGPHNMDGDDGDSDLGQPRAYLDQGHRETVDNFAKFGEVDSSEVKSLAKEVADESQSRNMPSGLVQDAQDYLAELSPGAGDLDEDERIEMDKDFMNSAAKYFSKAKNPSVS